MAKFYISPEELSELRNSGNTIQEIADSYNVSYNTIARLIKSFGLSKAVDRTDISDDDVLKAWDNGMTIRQIAKEFSCSHDTITKRLHKYGITCNRSSGIKRHFESTYDDRWLAIKEDLDKGISVSTVRGMHHIRMDNLKKLMEKNGYTYKNPTLVDNLCNRINLLNDIENKSNQEVIELSYLQAIKTYIDDNDKLPDVHAIANYMNKHVSTVSYASSKYKFKEFLNSETMSQWVSVLITDLCRLNIDYEINNRKILDDGKEIDIYIPSKNLGIEINPVATHSPDVEKIGILDKSYHQNKALLAEKCGIGLLHLYDDDFVDKNKYQKLLMYLNNNDDKIKIGARKCIVKEITAKCANNFLKKYHFQNGDNSSMFRIGLYYNDILCGVLTIGKPRYTTSCEYEIIRYCMNPNYIVIGCFNKMLSYFTNKYCSSGDVIISYMDLNKRFYSDNVYEKNGFIFDGVTPPDYMWVHKYGNETLKRYATMKSKLVAQGYDETKSEKSIMLGRGYRRVYGAGSKRYVFVVK